MLLTSKNGHVAAASPRLRRLAGFQISDDGSANVSEAFGPRRRGRGVREPAAVRRDRQGRGRQGQRRQESKSSARSARTARSAARSTPSSRTACGSRQEPVFDSPLNLGAHCAKGASVREHGMHEHSHR